MLRVPLYFFKGNASVLDAYFITGYNWLHSIVQYGYLNTKTKNKSLMN